MKWVTAAASGLMVLSCLMNAPARAGVHPEGIWMSQDGDVKVRVSHCGHNRLCARVVWLGEPNDPATGRPRTDKHNPDPAKRARPLIGLTVAYGLKPSGPNEWSGHVYNAEDGHVYEAHLMMQDARTARLQGCVSSGLCRDLTWRRAGGVERQASR